MIGKNTVRNARLCALIPFPARPQLPTDMAAMKGLAPITTSSDTSEGRAAPAANYTVTGGIQTGPIQQATFPLFAEQRRQALPPYKQLDGVAL